MKRLFLASISIVLTVVTTPTAQAQFSGMKYRIPTDANTLVLFNIEKMFGSPVADRQRWKARRKVAYESGLTALPPDATQVVLAGRTDHEFGQSIWELSLVKLRAERNVATVATRFGGEMDNISGRSATRLPNDHYVVQITDKLLGAYTPANRQDVSRWLKSTDMIGQKRLPAYLEKAFAYATKVGTPIVMAMDISGTFSENEIKHRLELLELVKDSGVPTAQLAKLLGQAQGITLGITLEKETVGAIRVDFAESPELLADIGKPLLIEVLSRQGAMIDDFENWKPSINGNSFLLRGTLSDSGTRRVMSVLELPSSLADAMEQANSPGSDPEGSAKRIATQQYYQSVTTLIEDLRTKPKRDHVKTFGQAAMWYDKYARKIDRLPLRDVDEMMLNYGADTAARFRDAVSAMKGVGMRSTSRTRGNNPSSGGYSVRMGGYRAGLGYTGGLYGPTGATFGVGPGRASLQAKGQSDAVIRGQERTRGAATVQNIWRGIDESTAAIRREMTSKYSADF